MLQFLFASLGAKARYGKRFFLLLPFLRKQNCVVARVNGKTDGIIRPDRRREERDPETVAVGKNRPCNRISAAAEKVYFVWKTYFLTLGLPPGAKRCFLPLDNWSRQRRRRGHGSSRVGRGKRAGEKFSRKKNFSPVLFFLCFLLTRPPPSSSPSSP